MSFDLHIPKKKDWEKWEDGHRIFSMHDCIIELTKEKGRYYDDADEVWNTSIVDLQGGHINSRMDRSRDTWKNALQCVTWMIKSIINHRNGYKGPATTLIPVRKDFPKISVGRKGPYTVTHIFHLHSHCQDDRPSPTNILLSVTYKGHRYGVEFNRYGDDKVTHIWGEPDDNDKVHQIECEINELLSQAGEINRQYINKVINLVNDTDDPAIIPYPDYMPQKVFAEYRLADVQDILVSGDDIFLRCVSSDKVDGWEMITNLSKVRFTKEVDHLLNRVDKLRTSKNDLNKTYDSSDKLRKLIEEEVRNALQGGTEA